MVAHLKAAGPSVLGSSRALGKFCLTCVIGEAERFWLKFILKTIKIIKNPHAISPGSTQSSKVVSIHIPRPGRALSVPSIDRLQRRASELTHLHKQVLISRCPEVWGVISWAVCDLVTSSRQAVGPRTVGLGNCQTLSSGKKMKF